MTLWVAAYTKTADVYEQIGAGMDYAVASVSILNPTGTKSAYEDDFIGTEAVDDDKAFSYFIDGFSKITDGAYFGVDYFIPDGEFYVPALPDNIIIKDFRRINPGDSIPPPPTQPGLPQLRGGKAAQPGYLIHMDVPIYEGGLWGIGPARVEVKLYRMLQTSPMGG